MLPEVDSPKMPAYFYQITRRSIPNDTSIHNNRQRASIVTEDTGYISIFFLC